MLHVLLLLLHCCYISDREKSTRSVLQVNDNLHSFHMVKSVHIWSVSRLWHAEFEGDREL